MMDLQEADMVIGFIPEFPARLTVALALQPDPSSDIWVSLKYGLLTINRERVRLTRWHFAQALGLELSRPPLEHFWILCWLMYIRRQSGSRTWRWGRSY